MITLLLVSIFALAGSLNASALEVPTPKSIKAAYVEELEEGAREQRRMAEEQILETLKAKEELIQAASENAGHGGKNEERREVKLLFEEIENKTSFVANLSNGRRAVIKYLPAQASDIAQEKLEGKCAEWGCAVELVEYGRGNETKPVYRVEVEKEARFLLFFKKKATFEAVVDAETGEIIDSDKID